MTFWDLWAYKLGTLLVTLGMIVGGSSSVAITTTSTEAVSPPEQAEGVEVFPDSERAEEILPPLPPQIPNPQVSPSSASTSPVSPNTPSIADLQKKLEELTAELNKTLGEKSVEPSLFTLADVNNKTRGALVNIFCISKSRAVRSITGSGVFVDERGVILTNSHVAQLFLLQNYPTENSVNCKIRGGSPASDLYSAEILYLPPAWIEKNKEVLTESNPQGTGENDYAFLLVKDGLGTNLPGSFPSLPMLIDDSAIEVDKVAIVAGYGASFLGSTSIRNELYPLSAVSEITKLFTFGSKTLDLFSISGTIVAQKGSSGGATVDEEGNLIGIITTSTDVPDMDQRDLRAITISHIDRSLQENRGSSLASLFLGDLDAKADNFNSLEAPKLKDLLVEALESAQ